MIGRWKTSLAAQLVCFTLAALILSQGLTFIISWNERSKALDDAAKSEFFTRARTMTRLMGTVPAEYRKQALLASETSDSRFWLTDQETVDAATWRLQAVAAFSRPLEDFVDLVQVFSGHPANPQVPDAARVAATNLNEDWRTPLQNLWALPQHAKYVYFDGLRGYGLLIGLDDGQWLNAAFYPQQTGGWWTSTSLASLGVTASVLAVIGTFIANRIARPLRDLARSAEALGRGENLPPLVEEGPAEIRRTAASFNSMQGRLHRFVEDRTKMLAAIGHDLRTPLTSLRLRAEFVGNDDVQRKMLATIDEMQGMTEAAIAFTRGESTDEETRAIELEALVGSICDDQADLGRPVTYIEGRKLIYRCRPDGLRRAVRNIVENAVRYGGEANVRIRSTVSTVDIVVEDRGPGIPDELQEKVFAPFFRLETSRNRNTGGIGLGLSIARAVARQHGGDIAFSGTDTGMQATISLPRDGQVDARPARALRSWSFDSTVARAISLSKRACRSSPR
ncbi:ATP-binding protein [Marinivivus vitaminiproducens]|uniref:sensor histidine kinase n=1 Tax=Marinivivus vitaminiproducens TaxID=3035935 RepID=UPI0027A2D8FE|nr:ATP-binding protein [Geminicoccaceae bacterium SCSIO 64248]